MRYLRWAADWGTSSSFSSSVCEPLKSFYRSVQGRARKRVLALIIRRRSGTRHNAIRRILVRRWSKAGERREASFVGGRVPSSCGTPSRRGTTETGSITSIDTCRLRSARASWRRGEKVVGREVAASCGVTSLGKAGGSCRLRVCARGWRGWVRRLRVLERGEDAVERGLETDHLGLHDLEQK